MSNILYLETEKRKELATKEVKILLSEFSSRPENKGFEAMLDDNAVFFAVDVRDALDCVKEKYSPNEIPQH